jgi:hypothetical protein
MLRIPPSTLLVGTALFVVPAAAQTNSAAGQFIAQQSPDQWRAYVGVLSPNAQSTPAPPNTTIPEKMQPQENGTTGSDRHGESLSDKLDRSEGVLPPPADVDPGLEKPAPDVGTTRIIPPPGSPGGDPTVRPK